MIALIIIAHEKRRQQVWERVVPSAIEQPFDKIVVVGDWAELVPPRGVRYLNVAPLTHTTIDALVKRDVGTAATSSDTLVYLCDDHVVGPVFAKALRDHEDDPWDVLVPNRFTQRSPNDYIWLNNGFAEGYCGGHCGVFRRNVIRACPWSAHEHHRNWDFLVSQAQRARGAIFAQPQPGWGIIVEDIEPQAEPWK